jgi:hypothetical protein
MQAMSLHLLEDPTTLPHIRLCSVRLVSFRLTVPETVLAALSAINALIQDSLL